MTVTSRVLSEVSAPATLEVDSVPASWTSGTDSATNVKMDSITLKHRISLDVLVCILKINKVGEKIAVLVRMQMSIKKLDELQSFHQKYSVK